MKETGMITLPSLKVEYTRRDDGTGFIDMSPYAAKATPEEMELYRTETSAAIRKWADYFLNEHDRQTKQIETCRTNVDNAQNNITAAKRRHTAKVAGAVLVSAFTPLEVSVNKDKNEEARLQQLLRKAETALYDARGRLKLTDYLYVKLTELLDYMREPGPCLGLALRLGRYSGENIQDLMAEMLTYGPGGRGTDYSRILRDCFGLQRGKKVDLGMIEIEGKLGEQLKKKTGVPALYAAFVAEEIEAADDVKAARKICKTLAADLAPWARELLQDRADKRYEEMADAIYQAGLKMMREGKPERALSQFDQIPEWRDSETQLASAREMWYAHLCKQADALAQDKKYTAAADLMDKLGKYKDAAALAAGYREQDRAYRYDTATQMMKNNDFEGAKKQFLELKNYRDSVKQAAAAECAWQEQKREADYNKAVALMKKGDLESAQFHFKKLGSFKDCPAMVEACTQKMEKKKKIRTYVTLGAVLLAVAAVVIMIVAR